ncbi:hypothetical protein T440DRAFT_234115 [Plenodomus tracheiphilus IPT5]|uniref:Uncharacterized protein n=1 Tax=Plenodomus tracheiphilus IPT5 TaxID=1408161 RepID=A0A6A7BGS8_9PLEO|nr:hypothetical protein T440DRAFT_234115 [Plenodomus tracheiphilus IPT5]
MHSWDTCACAQAAAVVRGCIYSNSVTTAVLTIAVVKCEGRRPRHRFPNLHSFALHHRNVSSEGSAL